MALETRRNSNENLVYNGEFSNLVENGQILLLDEPLMIYSQENMQSDCAIVLDPINNGSNQDLNLPEIIFDGNYFQFENLHSENLQNDYGLHENFQYMNERQKVDEGLAVLEILCNNKSALDQPEFIDINKLSEVNHFDNSKGVDVLCISDDDDVVFVSEYREDRGPGKEVDNAVEDDDSPNRDSAIRRNPVRKARVNSKKLSKEHILEEDFALLDSSDDEKKEEEKENKAPNKKPSPPPTTETLKQWPVNAHERPEYNTETNKIEAFDYTIREIQKKAPNKKPRLETVPVRRKSKKKYFTRKRKPRVVEAKKVPITELKPLVDSTTDMLVNYFKTCKESKELTNNDNSNKEKCSFDNRLEVIKNQIVLFSLVNDLDQSEIVQKVNEISITENETKE